MKGWWEVIGGKWQRFMADGSQRKPTEAPLGNRLIVLVHSAQASAMWALC